ncbi:MAG: hypothetical protein KGJ02_03885 [Verrucomicrobiota bacterium]|nr:hypothetical protein [Verrucomicrobiota bacterium]
MREDSKGRFCASKNFASPSSGPGFWRSDASIEICRKQVIPNTRQLMSEELLEREADKAALNRLAQIEASNSALSRAASLSSSSSESTNIPGVAQESGDGKEAPVECPPGGNDHCVSQSASEERPFTGKAVNASSRFLNHERYTSSVLDLTASLPRVEISIKRICAKDIPPNELLLLLKPLRLHPTLELSALDSIFLNLDANGQLLSVTFHNPEQFIPLLRRQFDAAVPGMGHILVDKLLPRTMSELPSTPAGSPMETPEKFTKESPISSREAGTSGELPNNLVELTFEVLPQGKIGFSLACKEARNVENIKIYVKRILKTIRLRVDLRFAQVIKGKISPTSIHFNENSIIICNANKIENSLINKFVGSKVDDFNLSEFKISLNKKQLQCEAGGYLNEKDPLFFAKEAPVSLGDFMNLFQNLDWTYPEGQIPSTMKPKKII